MLGVIRRTPLTGGAEGHTKALTGRQTGLMATRRRRKIETLQAGRAKQVRAHTVLFVSTLFEIDISEEICGRFGSYRWINVCISRS